MASLLQGSIPLGSIASIPIRLHVTFPLVFAFALLAHSSWSWAGLGWAALMYGPVLLVTVLVHELGHSLAARRVGSDTHGILLWPLGGLAFVGHSSGPKADLFVAISGPITHIPQFLIWWILLLPVYGSLKLPYDIPSPDLHFGQAVVVGACWINVMLAAFNLCLPAYPLDGGRIFADTLLLCGVGEVAAAKATAVLAVVLGVGVIALGAWQVSVLTMAVGLWMLYTTYGLVRALQEGTVHQHPMFCYDEGAASSELPAATKGGYQHYTGNPAV